MKHDGGLFQALLTRRSRRVGAGMTVPGGPLAHRATSDPQPLSEEETAALVFAAAGFTGGALFDWDLDPSAGGHMLATLVGRTVPSAEAAHTVALFVINDDGAWLMPRPCDVEPAVARQAARLAANGDYLAAWRLTRIQVADRRATPSLQWPHNIPANRWSAFAPGTTTFLPVAEHSFFFINALTTLMGTQTGMGVLDDRRMFLPAGIGRWLQRKGGHLQDDPRTLASLPLAMGERIISEMACAEMGAMLQNLGLAAEVMGLGGFVHYAHTDLGNAEQTWFDVLGFRTEQTPLTRLFGLPLPAALMLRARGQDIPIRTPVGLEIDGEPVLKSYRPPYYPSMRAAVEAVVAHKLGPTGTYRAGTDEGRWRDPTTVAAAAAPVEPEALEATVAFCEYVWDRYGRFPVHVGAFHSLLAFQVSHLDLDFYAEHYRPDALTDAHRNHHHAWHAAQRPAATVG
jgi:hypothetical protein